MSAYPTPLRLLALVTVALFAGVSAGSAQGYNSAVGLRVGRAGGMSVAQRVGKHVSAEAHLTTGIFDDGTTATLLVRRHVPLLLKRVNLFVGGGVHKGWDYVERDEAGDRLPGQRGNPFGLDAQVGAEVTFGRVNVAFDYLPQLHLSGRVNPLRLTSALTIRYVIDKRDAKLRIKLPWLEEDKQVQRERRRRKRRRRRARD